MTYIAGYNPFSASYEQYLITFLQYGTEIMKREDECRVFRIF